MIRVIPPVVETRVISPLKVSFELTGEQAFYLYNLLRSGCLTAGLENTGLMQVHDQLHSIMYGNGKGGIAGDPWVSHAILVEPKGDALMLHPLNDKDKVRRLQGYTE